MVTAVAEERQRGSATEEPRGSGESSANHARRDVVVDSVERLGLVIVWLAMIAFFTILLPGAFFTTANFQTIFGSQAVLLMLALSLVAPFAAGEFDLSVAGVMGLTMIVVGYLTVTEKHSLLVAIVVALAASVCVGILNAFLVVVVGVQSIIVTLGTGTLLSGIAYGLVPAPVSGLPESLVNATRNRLWGLPLAFYYGLALTFIVGYVLAFTPLGRYLYCVGSARAAARLVGIRVNAIRAGALISASLLSGVSGIFLAGYLGSSSPGVTDSYLLPAFAALFLGSTAIVPGRFNAWGTFCAVYFLVTGITGLQLKGYVGWVEQVFYGGSLILAVSLSTVVTRQRNRATLQL